MHRLRVFVPRLCAAALVLMAGLGFAVPAPAHAQAVTLNLRGADLDALIATVAEATGRNFIVDPRVSGQVTVVSSRPLEGDALYDAFLAVLQVHGFAAVPGGDMVRIVPDASAPTLPADAGARGEEVVTRVIAVDNVPAVQLVPILRPLLPQAAHLAATPASNTLVVADSARNVERIAQIVARVDQPAAGDVEVIALAHASADELARTLTALTQGPEAATTRVVADLRTNSLLVSGGSNARLRLRALISHLDTPLDDRADTTHVVFLRYARADELAPLLSAVSQTLRGTPPAQADTQQAGGAPGLIQPDAGMNALVVSAEPAHWRALEGVIRQLDQPRAQVHVEAVIAEVSTDVLSELGVQWRGTAGFNGNRGVVGGTSFSSGGQAINGGPGGINGPADVGDGLTVGFLDGVREVLGVDLGMGALVRALKSDADTNVLSTPTLVTLDNAEAEIIVGQNVPFITGSFTSSAAQGDNPFQTIERQDVGLKLMVRPQINEGDAVRLEIEQEVSSIAPTTLGADLITNKRAIKTTVLVEDGRILVLGGLIDTNHTIDIQRVPVLGHLPMVGGLFNYQQAQATRTNLMVFIRPRILRDARLAEQVAGSKYNFLRAQQLLSAQRTQSATVRAVGAPPVLPELRAGPDPVPAADAYGAH